MTSSSGLSRRRRMVERRRRHGSEARTSRAIRSPGRHSLPAAGLERCHCLRFACVCPPEREPMASRNRRHSLFSRRALSCLAGPALSQCDLARFRADRRKLPLFGGPRLLAIGISGSRTPGKIALRQNLRVSWDFIKNALCAVDRAWAETSRPYRGIVRHLRAHGARRAFFQMERSEWHLDPLDHRKRRGERQARAR